MQKTAVVVMADPEAGEEALGRMFNALFLVEEMKGRDAEVALLFQGTGTRWPARLLAPDHPAHGLYLSVQDRVAGVSQGCATVFGAADGLRAAGQSLVADHEIPAVGKVQDLSRYPAEGWHLVIF